MGALAGTVREKNANFDIYGYGKQKGTWSIEERQEKFELVRDEEKVKSKEEKNEGKERRMWKVFIGNADKEGKG